MIEYLSKNNKKYKISIKIDLNENIHNEQGVFCNTFPPASRYYPGVLSHSIYY